MSESLIVLRVDLTKEIATDNELLKPQKRK